MALFSAARSTKSPIPEVDHRQMGRAGVAQLAVSRRGRCFVLCASRSLRGWRKEAPDGGDLGYFGLDSRPYAHPAGQHGPCTEVRKAAGLAFSRLHFGGSAPRAWRLAGVCRSSGEKSRVFRHSTCAFGSFLIPPFDPS